MKKYKFIAFIEDLAGVKHEIRLTSFQPRNISNKKIEENIKKEVSKYIETDGSLVPAGSEVTRIEFLKNNV